MNLHTLLEKAGRAVARRSVPVLIVSALVTALGLWGASRLGVETDLAQMLPADNPTSKSFTEINDAFSTTSVLAVVVEGADRASTIEAAETFAKRLKNDERTSALVRSVRIKLDQEFIDTWGFMLQDEDELADSERIFRSTRLVPLLVSVNDLMEEQLSDGDDEEVEGPEGEDDATALMTRFALFARNLRETMEGTADAEKIRAASEELAETFLVGDRYFFDPEGKTLLMTAAPTFDLGERAKLTALIKSAHEIAQEIEGAKFSFSGDVASEADEEEAIGADIFYPSLISIAVILVLFFFSFNRLRSILFATIALVAGIIVDLGFAAVTVKNLNMITSSFGALLVGLGIDFGIHIASRYDEIIHHGASAEDAMAETFGKVVLPVAIGACTTAIAFYSLYFSRTIAFSQFGLIAGTGILTTLLASTTLLPALLVAFPRRSDTKNAEVDQAGRRKGRHVISFISVARAAAFSAKNRAAIIPIAIAATVAAVFFIPKNKFEYDMRLIGPQGTEAQKTENLIGERFGISTYQALASAPDLESVRSLAERMKDAPLIRRVESIADYVPSFEEQEKRLAAIGTIAANDRRLDDFDWNAEAVASLAEEVRRLEMNVIELGDLAAASLGEDSMPVRARTATIGEIFGAERGRAGEDVYARLADAVEAGDAAETAMRLARIDAAFAVALDRRLTRMTAVDRYVTEDDLPSDIVDDFRSPAGDLYLVVAQPSHGLSGDDAVIRYSQGLMQVDPTATGALILGVELSREILAEARIFAVVAALLILALVGLGSRSIASLFIVALPFLMGFAWTFGVYPFIGRFNIVNALALPLILGIGIDYAVHFYTALKHAPPRADGSIDVVNALARTGKAVALSAATTIIGFGSLAFVGRFRGIADLGMTLLIGIAFCLAAAVTVLPALESFSRRKGRNKAAEKINESVKEAI